MSKSLSKGHFKWFINNSQNLSEKTGENKSQNQSQKTGENSERTIREIYLDIFPLLKFNPRKATIDRLEEVHILKLWTN